MDKKFGGISLGGIITIVGLLMIFLLGWTILGIIVTVVGLAAFGGFAKGKWY